MNRNTRAVVCAVLAACTIAVNTGAAAKRPITEHDLLKFTWIADPQISPDGATVAFVQVTVNEKDNKYESSLYTVATSGGAPVRVTAGTRDTTPRWSPDGKWIAFVRPNEKDTPQIHLLPMHGGEARALTELPRAVASPVWSPDGKAIAFSTTVLADDMKKPDAKPDGATPDRKSDVKVVTRAVYRANGNPTYVDPDRRAHIWTVAVSDKGEKPTPKQITDGEFDERGAVWSPDGTTSISCPIASPSRTTTPPTPICTASRWLAAPSRK
jgi:dipeptidyl aminopeptidase/acylaminoacyl peptidase